MTTPLVRGAWIGEEECQVIERELARDIRGRVEFNLREAIAESLRKCGREYTKEIIEAEMHRD